MSPEKFRIRSGITMIEMVTAMLLFIVMAATVGFVASDNLNAWGSLHSKVFNKMIEDGHLAGIAFETICRKSSRQICDIEQLDTSCTLYYYNNPDDESPDNYTKFYIKNGTLYLERGSSNDISSDIPLADNISDIQFSQNGDAMKMKMTLSDGVNTMLFIHSATRYAE